MAELAQSVVVCNLDGRILLYNNRARMQFKLLSRGKTANGNMPILGIGRSIYALLDQSLLDHALENIRLRMDRGAAQPATQFLTTTPSGQFLRVHMAPVRETEGEPAETDLQGFVLMLENVTSSFTEEAARDEALVNLTESARTHLASMRVILNSLEQSNDPSGAQLAFLREQLDKAQARIQDVSASTVQTLKTRWPLEEMLAADLVSVAKRRIVKHTGREVSADVAEPDLWVKVDSFSVLQSLVYLASRLVDEFDVRYLQLRAQGQDDKVLLDLIWTGHNMSTETVMSWELDSMTVGQSQTPLSVRDVMNRHSGMLSFERERVRHQAMFRLTLPSAGAQEQRELDALLPTDSRPEFFDFDLFKSTAVHSVLDDVLLSELSYTVFDTETTGLNPSQGDEIIQIGATRIVNGKLLRHEAYEQLVNPQRNIPAASIPIHGITQDMVRGRPTIGEVLPVFHAYAKDTVLVAHNAAFDMKFLQLKERSTGLRFDQPVLDTLLLSAVLHPNQESHRLDAIAQRMSITVTGRHNALGDAMATAEVFLRMIPLLADMGIHTLGQAREAAQKTFYARLKY
jgi:DNA polymerase-3 subunit epsilon